MLAKGYEMSVRQEIYWDVFYNTVTIINVILLNTRKLLRD
jgi:hypothetical protein